MNTIITQFADMVSEETVNSADIGAVGAMLIFLFFALIFALFIAIFVFWVIALIHLIQNEDVKDRVLWIILLFIVGGIIGPVYYFAIKKPYDKAKSEPKKTKKK